MDGDKSNEIGADDQAAALKLVTQALQDTREALVKTQAALESARDEMAMKAGELAMLRLKLNLISQFLAGRPEGAYLELKPEELTWMKNQARV